MTDTNAHTNNTAEKNSATTQDDVLFRTVQTDNGKKIAIATLNKPKALNALNLNMVKMLLRQLTLWQQSSEIAVVILEGANEKAFCAGGDVVGLYHDLKAKQQNDSYAVHTNILITDKDIEHSKAADFFKIEYQLNLLIHQYEKPFIVWGKGYVIGGGLGLFAGASHRIVTETTFLSMPEISIGLYPDVGASYFLNKMPEPFGLFLGLTGAMINASDALYLNIADVYLQSCQYHDLLNMLAKQSWQNDKEDFTLVDKSLVELTEQSDSTLVSHELKKHQHYIETIFSQSSLAEVVRALAKHPPETEFLTKALKKYHQGSALSAAIIFKQLQQSQRSSLSECLTAELNLSLRCCQFSEFSEGVRALLVDKDKLPNWCFNNINEIPESLLEWFFSQIKTKQPLLIE